MQVGTLWGMCIQSFLQSSDKFRAHTLQKVQDTHPRLQIKHIYAIEHYKQKKIASKISKQKPPLQHTKFTIVGVWQWSFLD